MKKFKKEIKEFNSENVEGITMMDKCEAIDMHDIGEPTAENLRKALDDESRRIVTDCIKICYFDRETEILLDEFLTLSFDRNNIEKELENYKDAEFFGDRYNDYYIDKDEEVHWVDENGKEASSKYWDDID